MTSNIDYWVLTKLHVHDAVTLGLTRFEEVQRFVAARLGIVDLSVVTEHYNAQMATIKRVREEDDRRGTSELMLKNFILNTKFKRALRGP